MDRRNGDCFDHDILFGHLPAESSIDHSCFSDYILDSNIRNAFTNTNRNASSYSPSPLDSFGCANGTMNVPNNVSSDPFMDVHHNSMNPFLSNYNVPRCGAAANTSSVVGHYNNNNNHLSCNEFASDSGGSSLAFMNALPDPKLLQQPVMHETSTLVNRTAPLSADLMTTNFNKNMVPDPLLPVDNFDLMSNGSANFMASPLFSAETLPVSKMDSDPFSPSISSSVSSIPSVEMADKSSYVPGSVDSGIVVNGLSSSPFSTSDSNRNGECLSINDCLISPLTQGPGSERSVETTPGSESVSSETCSPRVNFEVLSLELNSTAATAAAGTAAAAAYSAPTTSSVLRDNVTKPKEKSHKGRKRKNDGTSGAARKKERAKTKKHPVIVPTYQSQIADEQNGIKLKISLTTPGPIPVNKRRRKHKKQGEQANDEPQEQTPWGNRVPDHLLKIIFRIVTESNGCLPSLVHMSQVCRLWRDVALCPDLWYNIDLSNRWVSKNPIINDYNFSWLSEHRLTKVQELNLSGWTFLNVPCVLERIVRHCPMLNGIGLSGWENLNADHVKYLVSSCPNLQRINLSGVSSNQSSNNKSGVALNSLLYMSQELGERLTHLVLSDNKLVGIPQIITALATNCPNLELLDLSNARTLAATGHIHIEKLQEGCPKLRIFRITNSQVTLAPISLKEQMSSPGFPNLEELSVACMMNSLSSLTQPYIDDECIERILKTSKKLKLLDARNCSKVTDSSLVRVPAWDLTHLYLSGSYVTRVNDSGLELIAQKWSHSLIEVDFSWSTVTKSLDAAVLSLAEQGDCSPLRVLDLSGSSVNLAPIQAILRRCSKLATLNLTSCRGLPRGIKKCYTGHSLDELKNSLDKFSEDGGGDVRRKG